MSGRRLPFWRPLTGTSRRAGWHRATLRRWLCAILTALGVWVLGSALLPQPVDDGDLVVVAARTVPLGTAVSVDDLRVERRPAAHRPAAAIPAVDLAVGRVAAGPLSEGEVLTEARFQGSSQLSGMPSDRLAVSVPLVEAGLLASLRSADVVEVLAAGTGRTVAPHAVVLSVASQDGILGGSASGSGHVVLALTEDEAAAVATAMATASGPGGFMLALRGL